MPGLIHTEAELRRQPKMLDGRPAPLTFGTGDWYVSGQHDVAHADDLVRGYFCWTEWCHPDGLWMPPDKWLMGKHQRVRPGRWYAIVTWPHDTHPTRVPLDHLLQGAPMRAALDFPPDTFLSGYCSSHNDDASHERCQGVYTRPNGGGTLTCRCDRETCPCYSLTRPDAAAGVERLAQAVADVQQQPQAWVAATPPGLEAPASGTATPQGWTMDEAADLMVELDACPLCDKAWPDHVFTDEGGVLC